MKNEDRSGLLSHSRRRNFHDRLALAMLDGNFRANMIVYCRSRLYVQRIGGISVFIFPNLNK